MTNAEEIASSLTWKMIGILGTGHTSYHSSRVLGHKGVIKALQRRGLVGEDHRWTALGFEVAALTLSGRVKSIDDLHADALAEDEIAHLAKAEREHPVSDPLLDILKR